MQVCFCQAALFIFSQFYDFLYSHFSHNNSLVLAYCKAYTIRKNIYNG